MLSLGLKLVWFALSLSGLLGSWILLPFFTRLFTIPSWVAVAYGVVNTVQQVIFCIGLAWQMNPFTMPRAFCIAQATLVQASWSCFCGLSAALSLSTAAAAFDGVWSGPFLKTASTLPVRIALVSLFPIAILGLNLGFSLRLDAIQPSDSLTCDAAHPIWIRLLGYAGTSLLLAVPCLLLSWITAHRLLRTRSQATHPAPPTHAVYTHAALTSLPPRRRQPTVDTKDSPRLDSVSFPSDNTYPHSNTPSTIHIPKAILPDRQAQTHTIQRHIKCDTSTIRQSSAPSSRRQSVQSRAPSRTTEATIQTQERSRHGSYHMPPSPIVFNSPSRTDSHAIVVNVSTSPLGNDTDEKDESPLRVSPYEIELAEDDNISASLRWAKDTDRESIAKEAFDYAIAEDDIPESYAFPPYPRIRRSLSGRPPWLDEPPDPDPQLGYIVMFQILCSSTQILAAITSLIDIFSRRPTPTRFGTQHVALLLASWIPSLMVCFFMGRRVYDRFCS